MYPFLKLNVEANRIKTKFLKNFFALILTPMTGTICSNDSIFLQGNYQTTAGTYYDTLTSVNGCDSVIVTTLIVNPLPVVSFSGLDTSYCSTDAGVTLTGTPAGGTFSGSGGHWR